MQYSKNYNYFLKYAVSLPHLPYALNAIQRKSVSLKEIFSFPYLMIYCLIFIIK